MNTQRSYSYANIGMNRIMNRMNKSIKKKSHYHNCIVADEQLEKENNSKVHMSC